MGDLSSRELRKITAMMHAPAAAAALIAACAVVVLQGCGGETPAPGPVWPEFQCTGACMVHTECEEHDGDHDHIHYHQHDCVMEPEAPDISCDEFTTTYSGFTDNEKLCYEAQVCCAASNNTDIGKCATAGGSMCN